MQLCCLSKIFERLFLRRLQKILDNKKIITEYQFLDVKQAFDRVWYPGLLFKLELLLPAPFYLVIKSYIMNRYFYVKVNNTFSEICDIKAGILQGRVLGAVLHAIFTPDMPISEDITTATYAYDTALIACNNNFAEARILQRHVDVISNWFKKWNICINPEKSTHITFLLREAIVQIYIFTDKKFLIRIV